MKTRSALLAAIAALATAGRVCVSSPVRRRSRSRVQRSTTTNDFGFVGMAGSNISSLTVENYVASLNTLSQAGSNGKTAYAINGDNFNGGCTIP